MARNCWEFKECGREPGGRLVEAMGVCPAATFGAADGFLGGTNGGRACCFITGTMCDDVLQGTYRDKSKNCWECEFYRTLRHEHGAEFSMPGFALHLASRDESLCRTFLTDNRHEAV